MAKSKDKSGSNYLVGIDLGTSRSAIVTEDGIRGVAESVVGWPQDIIGVKVLGSSIAIGVRALELREFLEISFPLENGVIKEGVDRDIEAAEELLKHILSLAEIPEDKNLCGVIGVPSKASVQSKRILMDLATKVLGKVMLISEPFAIAYREEKLNNSIIIDMGAGTTNFCAMKGKIPDDNNQAPLSKAGNFVDKVLLDALKHKYPDTQLTINIAKRLKEKYGTVETGTENIIVKLRVHGKLQAHDITEEIIHACTSFVPDMIEEIEKLIISFDPDFQVEAMQNIILAGGMSKIKGYPAVIKEELREYGDVKVHIVDDETYAGAEGALKIGTDIPLKYWSQVGDIEGGE